MTTFFITPKKDTATGSGVGTVLEAFASLSSFPVIGNTNQFYLAQDTDIVYFWNGTEYLTLGGSDCPLDGGFANSVYLVDQCFDGGAA